MDPRNSRSAVKPRDGRSQKPWLQTATKALLQPSSLTGSKGRSETTRCLTFRDTEPLDTCLWLFGKCKAICGPALRPTGRLEENYIKSDAFFLSHNQPKIHLTETTCPPPTPMECSVPTVCLKYLLQTMQIDCHRGLGKGRDGRLMLSIKWSSSREGFPRSKNFSSL